MCSNKKEGWHWLRVNKSHNLFRRNPSLVKDTEVTERVLRCGRTKYCRVQHRLVPTLNGTVLKQDVSCSRLILYLQCAALQLGLFHWVPSDDDGVPRAKFKSLVGPKLRHLPVHKCECVFVCMCECVSVCNQ